jgi:hypothetical protein
MNRAHHREGTSLYLPSNAAGFGTQEENARRFDAEEGSRRLLEAIQRYFERRRAA